MKKAIHVAFIAGFIVAFIAADGPELQVTYQNSLAQWRDLWRWDLR